MTIASHLFREQGYKDVGMRDIAAAADMRAASLYHHFPSKEDLLTAIVYRSTRDFVRAHLEVPAAGFSPAERLAMLVRAHIVYIWGHRAEAWVTTHELGRLPEAVRETVRSDRYRYQQHVADCIRLGIAEGQFANVDSELFTIAILDMINGVSRWLHSDSRYDIEEVADRYEEYIFAALKAEPPELPPKPSIDGSKN